MGEPLPGPQSSWHQPSTATLIGNIPRGRQEGGTTPRDERCLYREDKDATGMPILDRHQTHDRPSGTKLRGKENETNG